MEIVEVDPRTTRWELDRPAYRVRFWDSNSTSWEYELHDAADVGEVLAWAAANRGDRAFAAYVVIRDRDNTIGLARIHGTDPTPSVHS